MGPADWNDHMVGGWWWIPMMIMMFVVVGGLIWLAVTLIRHGSNPSHLAAHAPGAPAGIASPPRSTPQEILAERLARGEIEPDDYRQRLAALKPPTGG
ncbi:MAG: SHOCT domain-containing protein [Ilumatobacteraceae bacterium]